MENSASGFSDLSSLEGKLEECCSNIREQLLQANGQLQEANKLVGELQERLQEQVNKQQQFLDQITQELKKRKLKLVCNSKEVLIVNEEDEGDDQMNHKSIMPLVSTQRDETFKERLYNNDEMDKIRYLQKIFHNCHILHKWKTIIQSYKASSDSLETRKRYLLMKEIIQSEKSYNTILSLVISEYMNPLYNGVLDDSVLSKSDVDGIFSNLFAIKELSNDLLETLEAQYLRWPVVRLYFGETFEKLAPFFQCYSEYIGNYQRSLMITTNLKQKDQFAAWIEGVSNKSEFRGLYLHDCLIMPIQRVPRYVLLLKELLKYTPEYHIEYEGIKRGFEKTKQIASQMNQKQKLAESIHRVYEIQNLISSEEFNILSPHRRLVKEGDVVEVDEKLGRCSRHACLFNDLIITTSSNLSSSGFVALYSSFGDEKAATWILHTYLPLENAMVTELPEDGAISPVLVTTPHSTLILEFSSDDEKCEWLRDIGKVIAEMIEKDLSYAVIRERNAPLDESLDTPKTCSPLRGSHEGYLYSRNYSPNSKWKKRWCVVANGFLHIYEEEPNDNVNKKNDHPDVENDDNNLKLISSLKLKRHRIKQLVGEHYGRFYCFELFSTPADRYLLSAFNQYDLEYWIAVITPYLSSVSSPLLSTEYLPLPSKIVSYLLGRKASPNDKPSEDVPDSCVQEDNDFRAKLNQIINFKSTQIKNREESPSHPSLNRSILHKPHHRILFGSVKTAIAEDSPDHQ